MPMPDSRNEPTVTYPGTHAPGGGSAAAGNPGVASITAAPSGMPALPNARNGYAQGAVHALVADLQQRLRTAEERLRDAVTGAGEGAARAATSPAGRSSAEVQIADLLKIAADEAEGKRVAAAGVAADLVRRAEKNAAAIIAGAKEQADTALATARQQAKETLDAASVQAAAVDEGVRRRLDAMTGLHAETVTRLTSINEVTSQLLAAEDGRGSLLDEVNRALPPSATRISRSVSASTGMSAAGQAITTGTSAAGGGQAASSSAPPSPVPSAGSEPGPAAQRP